MPTWSINLLYVAGAGALGSILRWGSGEGMKWLVGNNWPWGTLAINVLGCFIFGFGFRIFTSREIPLDDARGYLLFTGFLGAYTTYSTFAFDTYRLQMDIKYGFPWAMLNVLVQIILGWLAVIGGVALARYF